MAEQQRTRLLVEGVGTAITAEVTRRESDGLVVAQPLPFLRLHTPVVAEGGQRTRIARVAIAMEGDVPRLLLELEHEAPAAIEERAQALPAFTPGVSVRPPRADSTVPYDFAARRGPQRIVAVSQPPPPREAAPAQAAERSPERWFARLLRRLSSLLALVTRRTLPALPRG